MIVLEGWLAFVSGRLREYLHTRWLRVFVVLLVGSTVSAIVGGYHAHLQNRERYTLEAQRRVQLILQARSGPDGTALDRSLRVLRPPTPSAIVIPGHEASLPAAWDFGPAGLETLAPYAAADFAGETGLILDVEAVIRLFGGLFAIAFGAWTTTRDKLRGWSVAEAMLPIPEWSVTVCQLLSGFFTLVLAVLVWFAATGVFARAYVSADVGLSVSWVRVAVVALLYMTTLFGIGSAIAWWARSPLLGLALSGGTWVVLVLLGPQLLLGVSNLLSYLPSRSSLEQVQRVDHQDQVRRAEDFLGQQLGIAIAGETDRQVADAKLQQAYFSLEQEWLRRLQSARVSAEEADRRWRQKRHRMWERLRLAARFTPGTLLPQALSELSSVGWLTVVRWEQALESHRRNLNRALFDNRPSANARVPADWGFQLWRHLRHVPKWHAQLPQFEAPVISSSDRLSASWSDVIALLAQSLVALVLSAVARRRALRRRLA